MKWAVACFSLLGALVALWLLWPDEPTPKQRAQDRAEPQQGYAQTTRQRAKSARLLPSTGHEVLARKPVARPQAIVERRKERDRLRERIYRALGQPLPSAGATLTEPDPAAAGDRPELDKDYIQTRVRQDFYPLAGSCYEAALERDPNLAGTLVLSFVIVGDESVGGIVESVDIEPESTLGGEELLYCLSESMLSLSFEPPRGGGRVTVTYPFAFAPDEPDEAVDAE